MDSDEAPCYSCTMPKKDFSQIAFNVVQQATWEAPKPVTTAKQENSRKGGLKGGVKRMANISDADRAELARKAAQARWKK